MFKIRLAISVLLLAMLACTLPSATSTSVPASEAPINVPSQAPTLVTVVSDSTAAPASTVPSIQHVNTPGELPAQRSAFAGDQESYFTSPEKRASGGDRFTFGRYERPFNAETMDVYLPQIDITEMSSYRDNSWVYFTITLRARDANGIFSGRYAVEIDTDIDGRGDWLVMVSNPASNAWTTDGVQVWFDSNNDVGGSLSVTADDQRNGNGYETTLFDNGQGDDLDLAWARIPSSQPFTVQLAVKASLLSGSDSFMAGAWAGNDLLDPTMFDINDRFTQEQAGSSLVEFDVYYPIKAVAEIDNVCRVAIGFQAQGGEPGLCPLDSGGECPAGQKMVCVDTVYGPQCSCASP
jgi:hypothetical protein